MNYWLIKSEPEKYSFEKLFVDGKTHWDGVRNYAARNFLKTMEVGDLALYYHSNADKAVVGIAEIVSTAYSDPTQTPEDKDAWVVVDVAPHAWLNKPVSLAEIKADPLLAGMEMLRLNRLSVTPVRAEEYRQILVLAGGVKQP
jgi:predicted RNA-binding protein with PUA-like domain